MREAGWSESKGEAVEGPVSFSDDELARAKPGAEEGELAPAAIPDWLKDIAPQQISDAGGEPSVPSGPDWGVESAAETPETPAAPQTGRSAIAGGTEQGSEVPTWLEEPSPGATETIVTWLGDRSARAAAFQQPPTPPAEPESAPEAEQPDWLAQGGFLDEEPAEQAPSAPEGPPAWLTGVAEAAASEELLSAEPPSWVTEEAPEPPVEEEIAPEPQASPEAPDWLRAIAEPGAAPTPASEAEADWLAGLSSAASAQPKAAETSGPEWLRGIGEAEEKPAAQPAQRSAPDWLRGLSAEEPPAAPAEPASAGPEWLREAPAAPKLGGTQAGAFGTAGAGIDWLRGIGEPEEQPATTGAPAGGGDNEWLRGLVESSAEAAGEEPAPAAEEGEAWPESEPAEADVSPAETPDWLGRLAAAAPPPEPPSAVPQPSWLEEVASEGEPEATQEPDWIREMAGASQSQPSELPEAEADDWLKGLLDEASLPQEAAPAPADESEEALGPDWFALQVGEEEAGPELSGPHRDQDNGLAARSGRAIHAAGRPRAAPCARLAQGV